MSKHEDRFPEVGGRIAVIGPGESSHLADFREVTGYRSDLFADPGRETYQVLRFSSGITTMLGIKSVQGAISALKSGIRPGKLQGNALQIGGAVVIAPGGELRYLYREKYAGDHPVVAELLGAVSDGG